MVGTINKLCIPQNIVWKTMVSIYGLITRSMRFNCQIWNMKVLLEIIDLNLLNNINDLKKI